MAQGQRPKGNRSPHSLMSAPKARPDCPRCTEGTSQVLESRYNVPDDDAKNPSPATWPHTRRRRQCLSCGHRWTTYEVCIDDLLAMQKAYDRVKLGLARAKHLRQALLDLDV